jgi:hypothetical protein
MPAQDRQARGVDFALIDGLAPGALEREIEAPDASAKCGEFQHGAL